MKDGVRGILVAVTLVMGTIVVYTSLQVTVRVTVDGLPVATQAQKPFEMLAAMPRHPAKPWVSGMRLASGLFMRTV